MVAPFDGKSTEHEVRKIIELLKATEYGALIVYGEFERIIGELRGTNRFKGCMTRARKISLNELGKVLEARANEGYEVLKPEDQVNAGIRQARGGQRKIRKARRYIETADTTNFDGQQKQARDWLLTRFGDVERGLRKELTTLGKVAQTKTLPWGENGK